MTAIDTIPTCPYCGQPAVLADSSDVLSESFGPIWLCEPCQAWVSCHPGSAACEPLGTLANRETRRWRNNAHRCFDPLWKTKMGFGYSRTQARRKAYTWLADELGIDEEQCHIAMFDVTQCKRVVEVCLPYLMKGKRDGRVNV